MGLAYERAIAKALPGAIKGQWFEFEDYYGPGYCQTDFLINTGREMFVLEAKLTDMPAAKAQLRELYMPIVEKAFGLPTYGIVVVKSLLPEAAEGAICDSLGAAMAVAKNTIPILHWIGRGPLAYG